MTSYASEKHYLQDQITSNNDAIEYCNEKLKELDQFGIDHYGTHDKIANVYLAGISSLNNEIKTIKDKIKKL